MLCRIGPCHACWGRCGLPAGFDGSIGAKDSEEHKERRHCEEAVVIADELEGKQRVVHVRYGHLREGEDEGEGGWCVLGLRPRIPE